MQKSKIIIVILLLVKIFSFELIAQTAASNQSKYWFYRYRLTNEFLKKGEANCGSPSGYSIPASSAYKSDDDLHFGDGTSMVGFYISVLAMEHKLLRMHGGTDEQKNRTAQELYYAMKAYERVDKNAEKLKTDLTGNNCENDLNGFFIRDDVPASPNMNNAELPSTYLFDGKFKTNVRPFNIDPEKPNKIEYKLIHSDFAADLPNSNDPCKNKKSDGSRYPSQDQISDLLTGFALVETTKCGSNHTKHIK
jgi:hypothetical protein